ncbi:MAG TPA: flagellar basal body-associated protein FliL [Casimicrobiaceae bacterium]
MAKTANLAVVADSAAAPAKKKKGSRLLIVVAALAVLAAAGGGAAWWFLGRGAAPAEHKAEAAKPPVFHALEPFTVNLAEENGDHYLQVSVVYQLADEKAVDQVKLYLPVIRNRILMLLSAKHPSELNTPEGKQKLVGELVVAARESIPGSTPERGIVGAFLGAFVIQ